MAEEKKNVSGKVEKASNDARKTDAAKKVANAAKGSKSKDKQPNFFVRAGKTIKKFFKDFKGESKKIVWPDGKTVLKSSIVVIVVVAIVGLIVFGIDMGLSKIIESLQNVAQGAAETVTTTLAAAQEAAKTTTEAASTTTTTAAAEMINIFGSLIG